MASAAKASKSQPLTLRTVAQIEKRVETMRWASHETDDEIVPGSLADQFWNKDVPRLIEAAKAYRG